MKSKDKTKALLITAIILFLLVLFLTSYSNNHLPVGPTNATITPGPFPTSSCPAHFYSSYGVIENISGFSVYAISNLSNITDYVISPGKEGRFVYTVHVGSNPNINFTSFPATITNWVNLYHASPQNAAQNTTYGIKLSITPLSENFSFSKNYTMTVDLNASDNATLGTYWISFSPGFCFGGPTYLLTIGNGPYVGGSGKIQQIPVP